MAIRIKYRRNRRRHVQRVKAAQAAWREKGYWLAEFSGHAKISKVMLSQGEEGERVMCIGSDARPIGFEGFESVVFFIHSTVHEFVLGNIVSSGLDVDMAVDAAKWLHDPSSFSGVIGGGNFNLCTVSFIWLEIGAPYEDVATFLGLGMNNYEASDPATYQQLEVQFHADEGYDAIGWDGQTPEPD